MVKKDNLHYSWRKVDSYNVAFQFCISPRELGKSASTYNKVYKKFRKTSQPSLILRRLISDVTNTYIDGIECSINKFLPDNKQVKFNYKKGSCKDGVVDVFLGDKLFLRIIGLSNPMSRIKSTIIRNPAYIVFDEFIANLRCGEKYVKDEAFKFREIYNTYQRECDGYTLKCYFLGNPYSLYNPYFADFLQIDTSLLKPGAFIVNKKQSYVIDCAIMKPELRDQILARNPLYRFDDSYTAYAFNGAAVNDTNIKIVKKQPQAYKLKYIFRTHHKYLGIFVNNVKRDTPGYDVGKFWIGKINYNGSKKVYAVDFDNLIDGSRMFTTQQKALMWRLQQAIGNREVTYQDVECGNLTEELYQLIKK